MLPASNFVCEFGECVRPTSPMLGGVVMLACFLYVLTCYGWNTANGHAFGDCSTAGGGRGGAPRRARSRAPRRSRRSVELVVLHSVGLVHVAVSLSSPSLSSSSPCRPLACADILYRCAVPRGIVPRFSLLPEDYTMQRRATTRTRVSAPLPRLAYPTGRRRLLHEHRT